jgi:hypothetical protein
MKNSLKISILALIAIIAFTSCNSSLSITKRRYNKGYYVHHSTKPSEPKHRETHKLAQPEERTKTTSVWEEDNNTAFTPPENNKIVTASAQNPNNHKASKQTAKTDLKTSASNFTPIEQAIKDPVKTFKELSYQVKTSPAAGEALSLLWILIVILLIAYVLGLLFDNFGLGWVIHILLVVILVLLILWLLRLL